MRDNSSNDNENERKSYDCWSQFWSLINNGGNDNDGEQIKFIILISPTYPETAIIKRLPI